MKILLTGCAGFIGMHCALRLLERDSAKVTDTFAHRDGLR
jgi:nucleoside-diphosphate-sugar epimerase